MKASENLRTDLLSVAILGNIAFKEGRSRIPCHDKELMNIVNKYSGWGDNCKIRIKLMEVWTENWDMANINS